MTNGMGGICVNVDETQISAGGKSSSTLAIVMWCSARRQDCRRSQLFSLPTFKGPCPRICRIGWDRLGHRGVRAPWPRIAPSSVAYAP